MYPDIILDTDQLSSKKRAPQGIIIIAALWFIGGILNAWNGFNLMSSDLEVLPLLSAPSTHPWFRTAVPLELALSSMILVIGVLQIFCAVGLLLGKSWALKLALVVPLSSIITNALIAALYFSAPPEFEFQSTVSTAIVYTLIPVLWLLVYWHYLRKPHVRAFFRAPPQVKPWTAPIPQPAPTQQSQSSQVESDRMFCRYCGARNEKDAVFCEKCGKQIR